MLAGKHSRLYQSTPNTILLAGNQSYAYSVAIENHQNDGDIVHDTDNMISVARTCEDIQNQRHEDF